MITTVNTLSIPILLQLLGMSLPSKVLQKWDINYLVSNGNP